MKAVMQFILFFFPWFIRRKILLRLGFVLAKNSTIGYSILLVDSINLENNARIGHLNFFRGLRSLCMSSDSSIGNLNWVTASVYKSAATTRDIEKTVASLILCKGAAITNRHYIDCNAQVFLGEFSTFAGVRSQVLTHSIDFKDNFQKFSSVSIGSYAFVGSGCILLPGAVLPNNSILSAGSVLRKGLSLSEEAGVYSGNPAKFEKFIGKDSLYFSRSDAAVGVKFD